MLERLVNAMERRGWCQRITNPHDKIASAEKTLRVMLQSATAFAILLLLVLAYGLYYFKGLDGHRSDLSYDYMLKFGAAVFLGTGIVCGILLLLTICAACLLGRQIRKWREEA